MPATIRSASAVDGRGFPVSVEVHVSDGPAEFAVGGVPDVWRRELRDRIRAAIVSSGYDWPTGRITVQATADRRVTSMRGLELPAAVGILAASEQISLNSPAGSGDRSVVVGDLGLDGTVRPVPEPEPLTEAPDTDDVMAAAGDLTQERAAPDAAVRAATSLRDVCDALSVAGSARPDAAAADPG